VIVCNRGQSWRRFVSSAEGYNAGMSKLTPKQRENLPAKEFGLPEKARSKAAKKETGNYPMPDKGHAISALTRARAQHKAGNLTKDEFERIDRKARKKLRKKKKSKAGKSK
jgi:hypothetical protein